MTFKPNVDNIVCLLTNILRVGKGFESGQFVAENL
jgi:hypothetical protein